MDAPAHQTVRNRRVFYIPGYDPIHPRRYRELYRKEGAEQAKISGYTLELSPKEDSGVYGWNVATQMDGAATNAQVDVLLWSDIVRDSMEGGVWNTYRQMLETAFIYISSGALFRLMPLRKGPVIAALYPIGMLLAQLLLALIVGAWISGKFLSDMNAILLFLLGPLRSGGWPYLIFYFASFVLWGAVISYILRWFEAADSKIFAYYLMHDFAFSARWHGANPPQLEDRMDDFQDIIVDALYDDVDEVLIVGHSSGAHLAVSILADLIRAGEVKANGPKLAFLSLGQVVPMVSFLPKAERLRRDLHFLSSSEELTWIDISAPGDGCAFALCDPVSVSGVEPKNKKWPLVFSAAFTQTLSPERWKALRWRFFRLHFQYLCAFDKPKGYDYFEVTAGPLTLFERYKDRPQSRSRIDVAASGHVSMAS